MRSEKTHTLAGNECNVPMRHRAVRKNTHAGLERMQSAIVRSEKTHTLAGNECRARMCHRVVRRNTHAGRQRMQRADAPSCGQKKHTRWLATNRKCGCAIVQSEKTHTLAGNECNVPMRHRAVRKNTHAGRQRMQSADVPSCGQKKHTRWPATNATCRCAIVRSEKTHTLAGNKSKMRMRHRAVRKDTNAGRQRMQRADAPSCGQKKHTRWPATNGKCGCAIVRSEETHTLAGNECNVPMRHRACQHSESKKVVFFTVPHPLQLFQCLPQSEMKLGGLLFPHFGQGSCF